MRITPLILNPRHLVIFAGILAGTISVQASDPAPAIEVNCGMVYSLVAMQNNGAWVDQIPATMGSAQWTHMLVLSYAPFVVLKNNGSHALVLDGGGATNNPVVKFRQPQLGLRFQRIGAPGSGFVTTDPVPLDQMYVARDYSDGKIFTFNLFGELSGGSPTGHVTLLPGESKTFSPNLPGASYSTLYEGISNVTTNLKAAPVWNGPAYGYLVNWLAGRADVNSQVNETLRVVPTRGYDYWDVEISRLPDTLGCRVFRYTSPASAGWPAEPGSDQEITNFPFKISDTQGTLLAGTMEAQIGQAASNYPVKPLFSVLVPALSANLFLTDKDGNGIDDTWETTFFGASGVDASGDADGDGSSNYFEFLAGTSPLDGADFLRQSLAKQEDGSFNLEWSAVAQRSYVVESSTDLGDWTTVETVTADSATCTYPLGEQGPELRFFRIRILPLQ